MASLVVHGQAMRGDFTDDDFLYFYELKKLGTLESMLRPFGQHFMASFKLVVALEQSAFGMRPHGYFAVVLLTHLANVLLLYGIVRALSRSQPIATVAAFLWGSAPAFQPTLSWFSAYSHMLSTTAALLALWEMARAVEERRPPTSAALVRTNLILLAGAATMLTGTITALAFPAVVLLLLPRESAPLRSALAVVPAAAGTIALLSWLAKSDTPLLMGPMNAILMFPQFVAYGLGIVFAGPFVTVHPLHHAIGIFGRGSSGTAVALSLVPASMLFGVVAWRLVRGEVRERRVLLALLGLGAMLYAGIAIGRSAFTFGNPLSWLATRDRYHYDANPALVIAVAVALAGMRLRLAWPRSWAALALAAVAWTTAVAWTAAGWYVARAGAPGVRQTWTRDVMDLTDEAIRRVVRGAPGSGTVFIRNEHFPPDSLVAAMGARHADFPGIAAYWIIAHGTGPVDGRLVRFFEPDPRRLQAIRAETRKETAAMFVGLLAVKIAGATVLTIEKDAPRELAAYLATTIDPLYARSDHARAEWVRKALAIRDARARRTDR